MKTLMDRLASFAVASIGPAVELGITGATLACFGCIVYGLYLLSPWLGWVGGGAFGLIALAGITLFRRSKQMGDQR